MITNNVTCRNCTYCSVIDGRDEEYQCDYYVYSSHFCPEWVSRCMKDSKNKVKPDNTFICQTYFPRPPKSVYNIRKNKYCILPNELERDTYKFIRVGEEFRFGTIFNSHSDLLSRYEIKNVTAGGFVKIRNNAIYLFDRSISLHIGFSEKDENDMSILLNKKPVSKYDI